MSFEIWVAFALTSAAVLAVPGPTVVLVVGYALNRGRATGWVTAPGVALGDLTAMTASALGAGAVLAASAELFTLLKYAGAAYLIWLGIKMWRAAPETGALGAAPEAAATGGSGWDMFWTSYVVTALNPKSIVFFVAFVPQFVDPAGDLLVQFAILEATFVILAAVNVAIWAALAGRLRERFRKPAAQRLVQRLGGGFLIGAGLLTALARRNGGAA